LQHTPQPCQAAIRLYGPRLPGFGSLAFINQHLSANELAFYVRMAGGLKVPERGEQ
jgi:hypothetical protein